MVQEFVKKLIKKYRNKLFLLLIVLLSIVLLILFLTRLTKKSEIVETPTVVFTQWLEKEADKELLLEIISEFENLHDDFRLILNTCSYEDLRLALFQGAPLGDSRSPGDVIVLDPLWVSELSKKEIIENVNANPVSFINILYYNINLLKEAGFSRPPKTRGEFLAYTRRLSETKGNPAGLALGMNSSRGIYDDVLPWIWSAGVQLIKDGKPQVNSRQVVDSLSFLASLYNDGLLTPQSLSENPVKKLEDFISGKAAFIIAPASEIGFVREKMGDEAFGVTSVPIPDNYAGKSFFAVSAWTVGVFSASAHKEEAKLFADFLAEKTGFISDKLKAIPGNGVPPAYDVFYSKVWDIAIAGEMAQDFSGLNWTALEECFREELLALFGGMATAAQTASAIQKRWEGIIP
jgi:multiple sugar transport system substrate-binding protein